MLPDWPAGTVAILSTHGETPHAIPVSAIVRAGPSRMLIALGRARESLARLRTDPRVALVILATGDVALTAHGSARVAQETLVEGVAAIEFLVERVQDHRRTSFAIDAGISWHWTDPQAKARDAAVLAALERLAAA